MSLSLNSLVGSTLEHNDRQIRPARVAILHGSFTKGNDYSSGHELHEALIKRFQPLYAHVISLSEMTQDRLNDLISSPGYDVISLLGEARDFESFRRIGGSTAEKLRTALSRSGASESEPQIDSPPLILAFAPNTCFRFAKSYLRIADSVVFCDFESDWILQASDLVYRFLESLVLPSMLNIDLADVKHIARGIGLAFNLSDTSPKGIISRLPGKCLVARSALLHFSCDPDVRLREVYSISKAIALKKGIPRSLDPQIQTHADARKVIRKVNVKMGIRIEERRTFVGPKIPGEAKEGSVPARSRISLTAIFFGL